MSSNPNTEQSKTMDVQTAQRVEQEKITRRVALRKLGFGAGLAAFSLLGVDDLARIVGQRMERMAGDNKVANQVAKEFQQAGVAFAVPQQWPPGDGCPSGRNYGQCSGPPVFCQHCADQLNLDNCYCASSYGPNAEYPFAPDPIMYQHCSNQAAQNANGCECCWCYNDSPVPADNTCPPVSSRQPPQGCNC